MKNADPNGFCVLEVPRSRVQNISTIFFTLGAVNYRVCDWMVRPIRSGEKNCTDPEKEILKHPSNPSH